jgi:hypothetical protein
MMHRREWGGSLLACGLVVACSSSSNPVSPVDASAPVDSGPAADVGTTPDSGGPVDSGGGADTSMAACNTVMNGAPVVNIDLATGPTPTPTGGTVADGTYYVTKVEIYGAPGDGGTTNNTYQSTNVVKAGTYNAVTKNDLNPQSASTGTFTTSGSKITIEQSCPAAGPVPLTAFSSDGVKTVLLFGSAGLAGATEVYTYTKQ